jgi:hypothetical protein
VQTFVVRVFRPAGQESWPLCGLVERSGSGEADLFETGQELIRLLEAGMRQQETESTPSRKGASWTST